VNKATILCYAPARWGKTHSLRTLKGNVLCLASELGETKGLNTLRDFDMAFIDIDDEKTMSNVLAELGKHGDEGVIYDKTKFDWVVLDSLSNLGYLWMEGAKRTVFGGGEDYMLFDGKGGMDPRQAYSYIAERGRQHFKRLLDLHCHILAIARENIQEEGQGNSKITFAAPELPGQKLPRELPGWPDATLHGVIHNGQRRLRTRTVAKAVAGIRAPGNVSVPELILPDWEAVKDLLLGDTNALSRLTPSAPPAK
jgi:hypothetical protein